MFEDIIKWDQKNYSDIGASSPALRDWLLEVSANDRNNEHDKKASSYLIGKDFIFASFPDSPWSNAIKAYNLSVKLAEKYEDDES